VRILGLDYGEKRIGVAVSDPLSLTAQPLGTVSHIGELESLMKKYEGIQEIVVGLPKTMRGEIGIQAEKVLKFVEELKGAFPLPVVTWDERLTTSVVEKELISAGLSRQKRKKVIDKSAAALILQSYLDRKKASD
jgi:putative Holliday junction resolvase